jgi:hypothetical protein
MGENLMPACTVCSHRSLATVNAEVQQGDTLAAVADRHGLSRQSLGRHVRHGHLPQNDAIVTVADPETASVLDEVRALLVPLRRAIDRAAKTANDRTLVSSIGECRRTLELVARLMGELQAPTVQVNVLADPQVQRWVADIGREMVARFGWDAAVACLSAAESTSGNALGTLAQTTQE